MKLFNIFNPMSLSEFIKFAKPRKPINRNNTMSLQNTKNPDFKFFLGDHAKDLITGFKGIIVVRSQYLTNCNTYGLKSIELKDGVPRDTQWFDEPHVVLIEEKVHQAHQSTGGPTDVPKATNREL